MKKILITMLTLATISNAGFFQEEDKQLHMKASVPFGIVGGMVCTRDYQGRGLALHGWEAIVCATAFGMIPGIVKEYVDSRKGGSGWDNRDLGADAIGAFIGAVGTVTIIEFSSGEW